MEIQLPESERRWLHAVLVLGTLVLALVLIGQVSAILVYFSDILLILLLASLLAFVISPLVALVLRTVPGLPRALVVGTIYLLLLVGLSLLTLVIAGSLANSISGFINQLPDFQARLPEILAPIQSFLQGIGFQIDTVAVAKDLLNNVGALGDQLVGPLTDIAFFGVGIVASVVIVIFLSLFIVLDKDRIVAYLNRLVPPQYNDEARLFETSVAASFGGFIRGQIIQGVVMGIIAALVHAALGLDFLPASAALAGSLQAIPFFGPIFAWAPPVFVALLTKPDVALPAFAAMAVGWFIVNNLVLPRVMSSAIGLHPVVVLVSALLGLKIAGVAGAVFALPFAAVIAAFVHHYMTRNVDLPRDVTSRAARRLREREGHPVRVPTPPPINVSGPVPPDAEAKPADPGA